MPQNIVNEIQETGWQASPAITTLARELLVRAIKDGGATLRVDGTPASHSQDGRFAVGKQAIHVSRETEHRLVVLPIIEVFVEARPTARFWGSWIDHRTGAVCIEPVDLYHTYAFALEVAKYRHQYSIYDLEKGEEINVATGKVE